MTEPASQDDAAIRDELSLFGLSDTEIDTYLALLSRGEAPTSAIAEDADVTQRAVYNIAERLEERGLVRVKDHASPTTVRAVPPEKAMGTLSERLDAITPRLEDRFSYRESSAPEIQIVKSRATAIKRAREAIERADHEVLLSIPADGFPELESELRAAYERDVFVFLLLGDLSDPGDPDRFAGAASAVRSWDEDQPYLYAVDDTAGMIGDSDVLSGTRTDDDAVSFDQEHLSGSVVGLFLSAYWPASTELHVRDPVSLPATFDWFRQAVFHAMLHDNRGTALRAEVQTERGETVAGRVAQVRQAFVEPVTNSFTLETTLVLDGDDGAVSVGGPGMFIEDYEAETVTLRPDS